MRDSGMLLRIQTSGHEATRWEIKESTSLYRILPRAMTAKQSALHGKVKQSGRASA
jgi:hypothetical protein